MNPNHHLTSMIQNAFNRPAASAFGDRISLPPARLDAAQTAAILGFQAHDIPTLVAAKLLKPLGKPVQNSVKYFAAVEVLARFEDPDWLNRATQRTSERWEVKNSRKRKSVAAAKPQTPEASLAA